MPTRRERHAEEALQLEEQAADKASGPLKKAILKENLAALKAILQGVGGVVLSKRFATNLRKIKPGIREKLIEQLKPAVLLGIRQGLEVLGLEDGDVPPSTITDRYLSAQVNGVDEIALQRLDEAASMAENIALDERTEFELISAKANTALTGADAAARWATNRAISAGTSKVAAEHGARLVWVPERDACLHCLAYAGWVVEPGQEFPPDLTYGDKPLKPFGALLYPPLHPNCRCQVDVTYLPVGRTDEPLVREAERSIARGLSDYASEPAMLRAADKLLKSPNLLPKSVRERAARNVAAGEFKARPKGSDKVPASAASAPPKVTVVAQPGPTPFSELPTDTALAKDLMELKYPKYPLDTNESLVTYQGSGFTDINSALRQGVTIDDQVNEDVANLDKVFEITPPLEKEAKVVRGMQSGKFLADNLTGQVVRDPAFLSTSIKQEVADEFTGKIGNASGAVLWEIRLPPGAKALPLNYVITQQFNDSDHQPGVKDLMFYEGELLLPRNTALRVISDQVVDGIRRIQAEVVL